MGPFLLAEGTAVRSLDRSARPRAAAALMLLLLLRQLPVGAGVAATWCRGRLLLAGPRQAELRRRPLKRLVVDHEVVLRHVCNPGQMVICGTQKLLNGFKVRGVSSSGDLRKCQSNGTFQHEYVP